MPNKKLIIPKKKYTGDTSVVSARLPIDLIENLDKIADKASRNRNEIIMMCLEYAIENLEENENNGDNR